MDLPKAIFEYNGSPELLEEIKVAIEHHTPSQKVRSSITDPVRGATGEQSCWLMLCHVLLFSQVLNASLTAAVFTGFLDLVELLLQGFEVDLNAYGPVR
jgi:hypothetical protein